MIRASATFEQPKPVPPPPGPVTLTLTVEGEQVETLNKLIGMNITVPQAIRADREFGYDHVLADKVYRLMKDIRVAMDDALRDYRAAVRVSKGLK